MAFWIMPGPVGWEMVIGNGVGAGWGAGLWVGGGGRGTGVVSRPLVTLAGFTPLWGSPLVWG